jgi:hypothetical protein
LLSEPIDQIILWATYAVQNHPKLTQIIQASFIPYISMYLPRPASPIRKVIVIGLHHAATNAMGEALVRINIDVLPRPPLGKLFVGSSSVWKHAALNSPHPFADKSDDIAPDLIIFMTKHPVLWLAALINQPYEAFPLPTPEKPNSPFRWRSTKSFHGQEGSERFPSFFSAWAKQRSGPFKGAWRHPDCPTIVIPQEMLKMQPGTVMAEISQLLHLAPEVAADLIAPIETVYGSRRPESREAYNRIHLNRIAQDACTQWLLEKPARETELFTQMLAFQHYLPDAAASTSLTILHPATMGYPASVGAPSVTPPTSLPAQGVDIPPSAADTSTPATGQDIFMAPLPPTYGPPPLTEEDLY